MTQQKKGNTMTGNQTDTRANSLEKQMGKIILLPTTEKTTAGMDSFRTIELEQVMIIKVHPKSPDYSLKARTKTMGKRVSVLCCYCLPPSFFTHGHTPHSLTLVHAHTTMFFYEDECSIIPS